VRLARPGFTSARWRTCHAACPVTGYRSTAAWLRRWALERDRWICTVPCCGARAVVADHIIRPLDGGADDLTNLRSLCRLHDKQVKEAVNGQRRGSGRLVAMGAPRNPGHG
jgi:5-methylcytosine-specific restriction protein A